MRVRGFVLIVGAFVACGRGASSEPVPATAASARTVSFDMRVSVPAYGEAHSCQFVRMPSDATYVGGGGYATTSGTHHFLLFRTAPIDPPPPLDTPVDCYEGAGVMRFERGFVSGGQLRTESADFPPGAALAFQPNELLLMQGHFLNAGASSLTASVHVDLRVADPGSVKWKVGTFRFYDPYIYVPPHGVATARMRCHLHHDVTILSAGSHMHRLGTAYRAYFDPMALPRAATPFFTTTDWQHFPYWAGPLTAIAGSAIRFECDYRSDADVPIVQGLSADKNEMCMFSAFYVPEQDDDENDCTSMDMHGSGTRSCAETNSCLALCSPTDAPQFGQGRADVGECWQRCIADSCPNVTEMLTPQLVCTQKLCAMECATFGAACNACIVQRCKSEIDACQALACGE